MNPGLTRALKHPLFVEKVGGTLHVAIGASYETCFERDPKAPAARARLEELAARGVLNRSAQHVDIVCDFRERGLRAARLDRRPPARRRGRPLGPRLTVLREADAGYLRSGPRSSET